MTDRALEPIGDTPEAFGAFLAEDRIASAKLVREAGITPQ